MSIARKPKDIFAKARNKYFSIYSQLKKLDIEDFGAIRVRTLSYRTLREYVTLLHSDAQSESDVLLRIVPLIGEAPFKSYRHYRGLHSFLKDLCDLHGKNSKSQICAEVLTPILDQSVKEYKRLLRDY
jgi:hypothetical protein